MNRKINTIKWLMAAGVSAVLLGGCQAFGGGDVSRGSAEAESLAEAKRQPKNVMQELFNLPAEQADWKGLTTEEKLEDFDYLYKILRENYPYMELAEEMNGIDWEEVYELYRKRAEASETDMQFFVTLNQFVYESGQLGHLALYNPLSYKDAADTDLDETLYAEEDVKRLHKILDTYNNPIPQEAYASMEPIFQKVMDEVQDYNSRLEQEEVPETPEEDQPAESAITIQGETENLQYGILEDIPAAYIKVKSFDMSFYDEDKKTLEELYQQYGDYSHVIFDFTENGGGGMAYFDDLILAPNIDREVSMVTYELIKDGAYNQQFFDTSVYQPISQLPDLPNLNREAITDLDLFQPYTYTVEPSHTEKQLKGRLWMLVNGNVYSSSEYAAAFAKASGFATLVGSTTGGDGIGSDPLPVVLENSGLIVQYAPIFGVSFDGTGSEERGTDPDVQAAEGESELKACIRAIREE